METTYSLRMEALNREQMNELQSSAADALIAGPRKGVKGPFIALLRSPDLMDRLQKVGEYVRFNSAISPRVSEFATLIVSRQWTQQFEWATHEPLALNAGTSAVTLATLRAGRRPSEMSAEEALVYDFCTELMNNHGVCDQTYKEAVDCWSEQGVIDLVALIGYFQLISMILNVSHIPQENDTKVPPLMPFPR